MKSFRPIIVRTIYIKLIYSGVLHNPGQIKLNTVTKCSQGFQEMHFLHKFRK
jgi:hypothetical protein